jgi:methylated-DNA-[protein]-cysteine S-methyltransferase
MNDFDAVAATPIGLVGIRVDGDAVCGVDFNPPGAVELAARSRAAGAAAAFLRGYFLRAEWSAEMPLLLRGTPFQRRVWKRLLGIPAGSVLTYGALARELHSSARAVGQACRSNPCPILVPCHRVVSANGIGGFAGATAGASLAAKRWLLRHEGFEC